MALTLCIRAKSRGCRAFSFKSSASRPKPGNFSFAKSSTTSCPTSHLALRVSSLIRSPVQQLGCVQSLLPLHSAVAVARMNSCLSESSRSCGALSQGTLCRTSPGLLTFSAFGCFNSIQTFSEGVGYCPRNSKYRKSHSCLVKGQCSRR